MGREGATISHFLFTDNFLLFGEATKNQMKYVMDTLSQFCSMLGQEVSHEKTSVIFPRMLIGACNVSLHKYLGLELLMLLVNIPVFL